MAELFFEGRWKKGTILRAEKFEEDGAFYVLVLRTKSWSGGAVSDAILCEDEAQADSILKRCRAMIWKG